MTISEFDELLLQMPISVVSTKYIVQDEKYKSLYPDMLQVVLQNNTTFDIKNAVVAFVAWDKNNLPVKIKSSFDFSDGSYIRTVNYKDINMIPNGKYGNNSGYEIDEDCGIDSFKAFVVSFESFNGDTWENPYYDEWKLLYNGVKYDESYTVNVTLENIEYDIKIPERDESTGMSEYELSEKLKNWDISVISTKYIVQDSKYKSLYPDMLQAVLQNNTLNDVKNAVVAFVAWDKNNLPVKIIGSIDFSDGAYIKRVSYDDINMIPGGKYGNNSGYEIDENCGIDSFKAVVESYETFDGNIVENPYYELWCEIYEGKKKN